MPNYSCDGIVHVCAHTVSYSFWGDLPESALQDETLGDSLKNAAEERAKECIIEDYVEGELNYETDEFQLTGWWKIIR